MLMNPKTIIIKLNDTFNSLLLWSINEQGRLLISYIRDLTFYLLHAPGIQSLLCCLYVVVGMRLLKGSN